ncbi:PREDICTED: cadherin-related family member 3-like [Gavialis gangeticus]|uniref:cadherin-related family member 3-like n=1 Tax=Gavialis gangeticus TaxID=94835 RepID=UPI00092F39A8|nr:PREDICTED: cadherin-related family member 3-like [Gavialis gangeticus]
MRKNLLGPCLHAGFLALLSLTVVNPSPVAENAPEHTVVTTITVTASPPGSFVGEPVIANASPVVHPFIITPKASNQWELTMTTLPELDFETVALYSLVILVKDMVGRSASQTIAVQISDVNEAPFFTGALAQPGRVMEVWVAEDTLAHTVIYTAIAQDPEEEALKYSMEVLPESSEFAIDETGAISTTASFHLEGNENSYSIVVKATDAHGLSATGHIKVLLININNNDPILTCTFYSIRNGALTPRTENSTIGEMVNITLDEEIPLGKAIGICQATDKDLMNDLTFHLDPGNAYFAVDRTRGTLMVVSRLDMEEDGFMNVQSFTVKACDKDLRCAAISVSANICGVNDNPPYCDQYTYRYTGMEVIENNSVVAELTCHDQDRPPDVLHYTPNSGPIGTGKLFEQVPGAENTIWVTKELDYEDPGNIAVGNTHEMMVAVYDDTNPSHTVTATIIVKITPTNDFSPVFRPPSYSFTVPETSGAHYTVGKVTAIDNDYPPNCITYRIVRGNLPPVQIFWVDPASGTIELITQPDYESIQQYKLTVQAVDCDLAHPRTAVTTVTIDIEEENDEPPVCSPRVYKAVVFDNVTVGTNIDRFRLVCHDRDSSDSAMRFEIVSGNRNNRFGFDPARGSSTPKLIVKTPFHLEAGAESQQRYHLVVNVIDDNLYNVTATKARTGTVLIDVHVLRANPTPAPHRKGLTIMYTAVNTYNPTDWYIPFIFTLTAILAVGLAAWGCHLVWTRTSFKETCFTVPSKTAEAEKGVETFMPGAKKKPVEVVMETAKYKTKFDGEARDPVTGNLYLFNSKSGARKWKKEDAKMEKMQLTNIYSVSQKLPAAKLAPLTTPINRELKAGSQS